MSLLEKNSIGTNKFEITAKVDADVFEVALSKAFQKNNKTINMPGFRKGKAPRKMVEKMYGEGVFFEDAINDLYPDALMAAIDEAGLEVVARPEVEILTVSKEEGFTFKATCIVKPEVEISDYKGIKATKTVKTVSDEDVAARLDSMADRTSRLVDITDRAVLDGDTVIFDFDGSIDGVPFDGGKAEKFSLVIGSGQFIPGFEPQMIGKKIDEDFAVEVPFPDNYHVDELKGKVSVFKCKIHEIKCKEVPTIDDEFATEVSEFDTLAELKADIIKKMEEQNEKAASDEVENALIDKVIENLKGEIPEEMFEARVEDMIRDFEYRLQSQGMNLQTYLQYTGMEIDSFKLTFKDQAQKQVKIRLALEKIAELENIVVSDEIINEEYARLAETYKMEVDKIKDMVPQSEFVKDLAVNKAIDLVKECAKITEKKETAAKKEPATKKAAPKKAAKKDAE